MTRPNSPKRSKSRPSSPKRPSSSQSDNGRVAAPTNANGSPQSFRPGGSKATYNDVFLQYVEEEMAGPNGRPNTTGHPSVRQMLRSTASPDDEAFAIMTGGTGTDGTGPIDVQSWDDGDTKTAEKIIKTLRTSLKETKETVEALKVREQALLTEKGVMTDLLVERKLMAEESLAMAQRLQAEVDKLRRAGSGDKDGLDDDDAAEGFASWRQDRARLGKKLKALEGVEERLKQELAVEAARFAELKAQLDGGDDAHTKLITTLKAEKETAVAALNALTEQVEADRKYAAENADDTTKNHIALLEKTNNEVNDKLEKATAALFTKETMNSYLQKQLKEIEDAMLENDEEDESIQMKYANEVRKVAELNLKSKEMNEKLLQQSQTIVDNSNHIHKLETSIDEKNQMNSECRDIIANLEGQLSTLQSDFDGKLALCVEQAGELSRLKEGIIADNKAHADALEVTNNLIESLESTIVLKNSKIDSITGQYDTAVNEHNTTFAHMSKLHSELTIKYEDLIAEDNKNKAALIDWEKKMSLFEIMQEMEAEAKSREDDLNAQLEAQKALREQDRVETDIYLHNWHHYQDKLEMTQNDGFTLQLLNGERSRTRQLLKELKEKDEHVSTLKAEMQAFNDARVLEQLDFEKTQKLALNNVTAELRSVISSKTVELTLLMGTVERVKATAEKDEENARNTIADRVLDIADRDAHIAQLNTNIDNLNHELFEKETLLVRAEAEIADLRIQESTRASGLEQTVNKAVIESKKLIAEQATARAPRLRIQQLEELVVAVEEKAMKWEVVANEYMEQAPHSYQTVNNDGYKVALSTLDGNVHGIGITSIIEHTLGLAANKLVNTLSVNEKSLAALRHWISAQNMTEESEARALREVCLSWSGLESMTNIRESMRQYGTLDARLQDGAKEPKPVNSIMVKGDAFHAELEQRLFTLLELGNVSIPEFRAMRDLMFHLDCDAEDIKAALRSLNLSFETLLDRAMQEMGDAHEERIARDAYYDLKGIRCVLSVPRVEMACEKEFMRDLTSLEHELQVAMGLREEFSILRKSFNQASTQLALLHDVRANALNSTRVSARIAASNKFSNRYQDEAARNAANGYASNGATRPTSAFVGNGVQPDMNMQMIGSVVADDLSTVTGVIPTDMHADIAENSVESLDFQPAGVLEDGTVNGGEEEEKNQQHSFDASHEHKHMHHKHFSSLENARNSLRQEMSDERNRRYDEIRSRGLDADASASMDTRAARLMYRTDHNLATVEMELAEGGAEVDKSRIVFIKLLRHRLIAEAAVKEESAVLSSRVKKRQQESESHLQYLEEAIAAIDLSATSAGGGTTIGGGGSVDSNAVTLMVTKHIRALQGRIKLNNARVDGLMESTMQYREAEVNKNNNLYRDLEERLLALRSEVSVNQDSEGVNTLQSTQKALAAIQWKMQSIRRQDATLERLHHVIDAFSLNLLDRSYKPRLDEIKEMLRNFQIMEEAALGNGNDNLLRARIQWNNTKIPSIDTIAPMELIPTPLSVDLMDGTRNTAHGSHLSNVGPETEDEPSVIGSVDASTLGRSRASSAQALDSPASSLGVKAGNRMSPLQLNHNGSRGQGGVISRAGSKGSSLMSAAPSQGGRIYPELGGDSDQGEGGDKGEESKHDLLMKSMQGVKDDLIKEMKGMTENAKKKNDGGCVVM